MPLSSEMLYNDLDGESVKEILLIRCADLLNQVKEFNRTTTLPRVKMKLSIHLEIHGCAPPTRDFSDELLVRMRDEGPIGEVIATDYDVTIDADPTSPAGQHPDQIREEHGLPVMEPRKGAFGNIEDVPVVREDRIKYAFHVTQDYGPVRGRTGNEGPVLGAEVIGTKNAGAAPDVLPDRSRLKDPNYKDKYDVLDVNGQRE